jgi:hypothetical protein
MSPRWHTARRNNGKPLPVHIRSIARMTWALAALMLLAATPSWAQERKYPSDALCKKELLCRRCDGPSCMKVATPAPWPEVRLQESTVPFNIGSTFRVRFPKDPSEVVLVNGPGDATVRYGARRWISVQLLSAASAGLPQREGEHSSKSGELSYSDVPRILHMNTAEDAEPKNLNDRRIWRSALTSKNGLLANSTELIAAEKGPLTVYLSNGGVANTSASAWVVHRNLKDYVLLVQAKGFSFDDFRQVVASIDALRE